MKKINYFLVLVFLTIISSCQQEDFLPEPPPDDNPQDSIIVDSLFEDTIIVDTVITDTTAIDTFPPVPLFGRIIIEETQTPGISLYGNQVYDGCGFITTVNDEEPVYTWNYFPGYSDGFYLEPYELHNGDHVKIECFIPGDANLDFGYVITFKINEFIKVLDLQTNTSDTLFYKVYEYTVDE